MKDDNKIVLIKAALEKFGADTIKNIVTRKKEQNTIFYRKGALDKFLDTYFSYFTPEELELLEYKNGVEDYIDVPLFNENGELREQQQENIERMEKEKTTNKIQNNTKSGELQKDTFVLIREKLEDKEIANKFIFLLDNIDSILDVKKMVENNIMIPKELLDLDTYVTSMRINKELLDRFNNLCLEYKNYSKIQMLNFAIYEFLEKYDKK